MFCTEYPRPNFLRKEWQNLNGTWDFEFDDSNKGLKEKWYKKGEFSKKINVPFAYQSEMSEINDKNIMTQYGIEESLELILNGMEKIFY